MEMFGSVVPEFSSMLLRKQLVEAFRTQAPPVTLICAAAGYGKTVLASQIASQGEFDALIWVPLPDADVSSESWFRHVADVMDCNSGHSDGLVGEGVRSLESVTLDDSVRVLEHLHRLGGCRVLLVMDGANLLTGVHQVVNLATEVMRHTSSQSRVLVTCRRFGPSGFSDPSRVWIIEERDLAFSRREVRALLSALEDVDGDVETDRVFDYCLGHPAITRILMRHGTPSDDARPRDLISQAERIVSGLSNDAIVALYLAAVLGGGGLDSLRRCALMCDLNVDWVAISTSVPLFHVLGASPAGPTFRVHAVLSDVLERVACQVVSEDDRALVRGVAFEELSRNGDFVRLAAALELHGTEEEVAASCESSGVFMMRHAGHASVARLMARLSPLSVASSSRLLLLRSHVQRAQGATAAALESAHMAKRMAEVNGDKNGLAVAALLLTRLHLDRGMIGESQGVLEEVESWCNSEMDLAVHCLTQSYMALLDGQAGRLSDATRRLSELESSRRYLDQGSDEAVFVANAMGAVACQCTGDWHSAVGVLGPLARRPDVATLQQVHIRSNYAAALYEIGATAEALSQANDVLSVCVNLGLASSHPYILATLSDISRATGSVEAGDDFSRRASDAFDSVDEGLGRATHAVNAARALRALGAYDESLLASIAAESEFASHGGSTRMMQLMASIEVAASQLALGDVALARAQLASVMADPVIPEALGHSLRCDLISAEIHRLGGDSRAAVEQLIGHAEYIATGSGNMTLACYVRAFPGLLGVLCEALGVEALPMRVFRLLPSDTLSEGVGLALEAFGPGLVAGIRHRCGLAGCEPESVEAISISSPDRPRFLRVRSFGKLEVESSYGLVEHKYWRKRKARMLFLLLLCAPSHELPRDIILERLWPDMDRAAAQRNFYVNWSHMRKALVCLTAGANLDVFADASSDACWLSGLLESDLDQFDVELGVLRSARVAGDTTAVVASAMRLTDIYRGELLPIDLYEEWFEEDRSRTKRDFCDAMVTGARCATEASQHDVAMVFLKRASTIDPWREDIYQLMMQCQMVAGQRSGAIETYNRCRARLVDDLGIDPSAETVRIFQDVLAMEDSACFESSQAL